jgi:AcrR family transcriptional regulator
MPDHPRSRGSYAKGLARRAHILDTALQVFKTHGYDGATLSAVATAAGISRESMRHYFNSRDELLLAVVHAADEQVRPADAAEEERGLFERIIQSATRTAGVPGLAALYATLTARSVVEVGTEASAMMVERLERLRAQVTHEVQRAQAHAEIRDDLPAETLAALIIATSDGLTTQALLSDTVGIPEAMRTLQTLMQTRPHAAPDTSSAAACSPVGTSRTR